MVRSRSSKPMTTESADSEGGAAVAGESDRLNQVPNPISDAQSVKNRLETRDPDGDFPASRLHNAGKLPPLPDGYRTIVNSVFNLPDPNSVYEEVLAGIRPIQASRASMSELLDAVDTAQSVALKARGLLVNTKVTFDAVAREAMVVMSAMRDQATAQLEREKEAGLRKKAITESDVENTIATLFPDEWKASKEQEAKARRAIDLIENMCERAVERARDLRAIIGASRSV
jgi:hypothetical protein